jgi:hypothetical protein
MDYLATPLVDDMDNDLADDVAEDVTSDDMADNMTHYYVADDVALVDVSTGYKKP